MGNHDSITLKQYYKAFLSLSGILAAAPPIIATLILPFLPETASVYGFPPMGEVGGIARLGMLCLALLVTYLAYFWWGGSRWPLLVAGFISLLCLCSYVALYSRFVVHIDVPSEKVTVRVSVGYDRTPFAKANFASDSDEDLLRARGFDDEEIRKLWTYESLIVARLALFVSYCGFILGLVAVFSLGIVLDLHQHSRDRT